LFGSIGKKFRKRLEKEFSSPENFPALYICRGKDWGEIGCANFNPNGSIAAYCIGSYTWVFQENSASDHDTEMDDSASDTPGDDAIYPADMHGSTLLTGLAESDGEGMLCSSTTRATS
jgi:hypothetical protein